MSEIEDRRQRAFEAFQGAYDECDCGPQEAEELAIETATQVKITPEAFDLFVSAQGSAKECMVAFLAALGLEVIE